MASRAAYGVWREFAPLERGRILKGVAEVVCSNARELAALDVANCGNPMKEIMGDAAIAAAQLE